jgi:hypothetical protein
LRAERQQLLVAQERKRQELAACEKTVLEERLITENLGKLGQALPNLSPQERKELIRLFVERVEVRRLALNARRRSSGNPPAPEELEARVMELHIKLDLPELIPGHAGARGGLEVEIRPLRRDAVESPKRMTFRADSARPDFGRAAGIAELQRVEIVPRYEVRLSGGALGPVAVGFASKYGRHAGDEVANMSEAIAFGAVIYVVGAVLLLIASLVFARRAVGGARAQVGRDAGGPR